MQADSIWAGFEATANRGGLRKDSYCRTGSSVNANTLTLGWKLNGFYGEGVRSMFYVFSKMMNPCIAFLPKLQSQVSLV